METNNSDPDQSIDKEPNSKRRKLETEPSTSSKSKTNDDCPILNLPADILAKVIAIIPIAQWPSLELLYDFRPATLIAWRQLRNVNVDRDFLIKPANEESSFGASIVSILQKLLERSPFLCSISGIDMKFEDEELTSDIIQLVAQFEHLQSICFGDTLFNIERRLTLENAVEFLETTRSRTNLKELQLLNLDHRRAQGALILDRFVTSLSSGREIQLPFNLEKFISTSPIRVDDYSLFVRLDTIDTTRLTDIRVGKAQIEPEQWTNLIERASNLLRIEFSFMRCPDINCNAPRLHDNKKLLTALASHENLTAMKFGAFTAFDTVGCNCTRFGPEFMRMLRAIGLRGKLRRLTLEDSFVRPSIVDMDEVCATLRDYHPHLHSIKLYFNNINDGNASDIVSLTELREVHLTNDWRAPGIPNVIKKLAAISHLKRLALNELDDNDTDSLKSLGEASTLTDLRIGNASRITADVFEQWSEGFAPNLEVLMLWSVSAYVDHAQIGLVRLLAKAVRLRVLIVQGRIGVKSLKAIAKFCPKLEVLGLETTWNEVKIRRLQVILDRCPKLTRVGGLDDEVRKKLQFPKYRKIVDVDTRFWNYDFDDREYN